MTINDTAPTTDKYNLSLCEVLPAAVAAPQTWSVTGKITPSASGAGATVTLSGAAAGTAPADFAGLYTFTGLANGSYTLTPARPGYAFNPTSQNVAVSGTNVAIPTFAATVIPITISPRRVTLSLPAAQQFTVADAVGSLIWSVDGVTGGRPAQEP